MFLRHGCADAYVSIPSSRNRPFGLRGLELAHDADPRLNPLIEESSIRTYALPGGARQSPARSQSPHRGIVHSDKPSNLRPLRRAPCVSIPSSRNRPFGPYGLPRPRPPACGLNPLIEESSIRTQSCRQATWLLHGDVSIPSSRNRPFGHNDVARPSFLTHMQSQSPHRGIVHSDSIRRWIADELSRSLNPLIEESSIRTPSRGSAHDLLRSVSIPSSRNRPFGRSA